MQTATITGASTTYTTTYTYSNPATKYLTETNSQGVVTGRPGSQVASGQPQPVTSQPAAALVPAGLSSGFHTITYNATNGITSFTIDVLGTTSTSVLGGTKVAQTSGSVLVPAGSTNTKGGNNGPKATTTKGGKGTQTGAAAASSSSGSASNVKMAGVGVIGLGAFFAALL